MALFRRFVIPKKGLASSLMVHLCAVITSLCGLYKHKYARFYSILLVINGLLVPLTVGLLTSGMFLGVTQLLKIFLVAIGGVYQIVHWQMEPWMALLWGVGQVKYIFLSKL